MVAWLGGGTGVAQRFPIPVLKIFTLGRILLLASRNGDRGVRHCSQFFF